MVNRLIRKTQFRCHSANSAAPKHSSLAKFHRKSLTREAVVAGRVASNHRTFSERELFVLKPGGITARQAVGGFPHQFPTSPKCIANTERSSQTICKPFEAAML